MHIFKHSFLPSKLHRIFVDFFVEESGYSVQLGIPNGNNAIQPSNPSLGGKLSAGADVNSFTNLLNFTNFANDFTASATAATSPLWSRYGADRTEKEK